MNNLDELCAVLEKDGERIRFGGWLLYDRTHKSGLRHLTVQIIPIQWNAEDGEPDILVHKRSLDRTVGANQWDFCGGHTRFKKEYHALDWMDESFLRKVSDDTAVEEANEQSGNSRVEIGDRPRFSRTLAIYTQASTTEEPDAGKLHARVCARGAGQPAFLPPRQKNGVNCYGIQ